MRSWTPDSGIPDCLGRLQPCRDPHPVGPRPNWASLTETLSVGTVVAGSILLAAGLYQFMPLKKACLSRCHSPVTFLTACWQPGLDSAFRMGLVHGA